MFCGKCGAQNGDNAKFCQKCGEKLEAAAPVVTGTPGTVPFKKKSLDPKVIGIAAIALVLVLAVSLLFGGRSPKATVSEFMDSVLSADVKGIFELLPDKFVDAMLESEGYSRNELNLVLSELQDEMDEAFSYIGISAESVKINYEIVGEIDLTRDDWAWVRESAAEIGVKIKDYKLYEVEMTIEIMGMEQTSTVQVGVIKVGGKWYIDPESMEDIF